MNEINSDADKNASEVPAPNPDKVKPVRHKLLVPSLLLLALLLAAGPAYAAYAWQNNKLQQANKELSTHRDKITELNKKVDELNEQLEKPTKPAEAAKSNLALTNKPTGIHLDTNSTASINYQRIWSKDEQGYNTFYIDLVIKNEGKAAGTLNYNSFKLKDSSDKSYFISTSSLATQESFTRPELSGKQWLKAQTIMPGEQVSGTLGFQVPPDLKQATLYFDGITYTVTSR